jgi:aromatic-L-amino-acid decarboxylase
MMDLKEFRANAHRLADWTADYLETLESWRVSPETRPGDVRRALPGHPLESAVAFDLVMAHFQRMLLPEMTWQMKSKRLISTTVTRSNKADTIITWNQSTC